MYSPDDMPDKTLSEARADGDIDPDEGWEDVAAEELHDRYEWTIVVAASAVFAKMLKDEVITLKEYFEYSEWLQEWDDSIYNAPML